MDKQTRAEFGEFHGLWTEMMEVVRRANLRQGGSCEIAALEADWEKMARLLEDSAKMIRVYIGSR